MSIDFIYFDLGKVILEFDHDYGCQKMGELAGVSEEVVREVVFDSGLEDQYETGLVTSEQFHQAFCDRTSAKGGTKTPTEDEFLFAASNIFTPNQRIFPLLAQLRAINFPIGILSNTCRAHWEHVLGKYQILQDFFQPYILSYEVKSMKPDGKIYERAIEAAGCESKNCFFVDDKQENVDGAKIAGIDAVLYTSVSTLVGDLVDRGIKINL